MWQNSNYIGYIGSDKDPKKKQCDELTSCPHPGKAQGVQMLLDAEVFDAGPGKASMEGFVVSPFFWKDVPAMGQSGLNVQVWCSKYSLGVTPCLKQVQLNLAHQCQ